MPNKPTGTDTRNTRCQSVVLSSPPTISPMNEPDTAATALMPERHAALALRKRVGENRRRAGEDHRAADALDQAEEDQLQRGAAGRW